MSSNLVAELWIVWFLFLVEVWVSICFLLFAKKNLGRAFKYARSESTGNACRSYIQATLYGWTVVQCISNILKDDIVCRMPILVTA